MSLAQLVACYQCSQTISVPQDCLGQVVQCPCCAALLQTDAPAPPPMKKPAPPPPPPTERQWFIAVNGKRLGPVSSKGLLKLALVGKILPQTMLMRGDQGTWIPASSVTGLTFKQRAVKPRMNQAAVPQGIPLPPAAPRPQTRTPAPPSRPQGNSPPPQAPRPQARPAAPTPSGARPAPRLVPPPPPRPAEQVTVHCPSCQVAIHMPRPVASLACTCPRCRQPFRAANTSVGVVCQRMNVTPNNTTVHRAGAPTSLQA